jgi:predicted ATPase
MAESLHDAEYQLRSLWGLWAFHFEIGRFRDALGIAQRFCTLAAKQPDGNDQLIGERICGVSQHFLGNQASARGHLERMLTNFVPAARRSHYATQSAVDDARATNHVISVCYALANGICLTALWVGDLSAAERCAGMLFDLSTRHTLPAWEALGLSYQGVLLIRRGDIAGGLRLLRTGVDQAGEGLYAVNHVVFVGEMAEGFGRTGRIADALAAVEQAIERSEQKEERWLIAELLRIRGELLLLQDPKGTAPVAEDRFRQALDWARRQGALSWELRAATSLARLLRDQGRSGDALALLQPVYDRFTEGFDTVDLQAAKALIDAFQ